MPTVPGPAATPAGLRAALGLLDQARRALLEAGSYDRPAQRYATAHLAALRTAAAVLAARARPGTRSGRSSGQRGRRGGPRDAWSLLVEVAPELAEWAAFFAAGAGKRAAAEAGILGAVTTREADDLLRDVDTFIAIVAATTLGVPHQPALPAVTRQAG